MFQRRTLTAMLFAAALPLAAQAQQTTLLFNSFIQPQHPINTRVFKQWVEDVAKATEGRVKLDVAPHQPGRAAAAA